MVRDVLVEDDGPVSVTIALTVVGCPLRDSFQEQVSRRRRGFRRHACALGFDVMTPEEKAALVSRLRGGHSADRRRSRSLAARASSRSLPARAASASRRSRRISRMRCPSWASSRYPRRRHLWPLDSAHARHPPEADRGRRDDRSAGSRRPQAHVDRLLPRRERAGHVARPDAAPALEQFLSDVHWGELDTLLVDMPPGTGDVAISLGQLLPRAEALVVTTPQPAAQQVAVRAAQMAQKTGMRAHRRGREHALPRRNRPGAFRRGWGSGARG